MFPSLVTTEKGSNPCLISKPGSPRILTKPSLKFVVLYFLASTSHWPSAGLLFVAATPKITVEVSSAPISSDLMSMDFILRGRL